jgi:hypothetical protein
MAVDPSTAVDGSDLHSSRNGDAAPAWSAVRRVGARRWRRAGPRRRAQIIQFDGRSTAEPTRGRSGRWRRPTLPSSRKPIPFWGGVGNLPGMLSS